MEKLDIKTAIHIAKILAAAPNERIPMILDVFEKAEVEIIGLDELSEWITLSRQSALIETIDFIAGLIKDREMTDGEYRIPTSEFNYYCAKKKVSARYARKHLYDQGWIRSGMDNGKVNYTCPVIDQETKKSIRCVCITPKN